MTYLAYLKSVQVLKYLSNQPYLLLLSSQPEQSEIKQIAAEGILTCLQDAIDSLEQKQV